MAAEISHAEVTMPIFRSEGPLNGRTGRSFLRVLELTHARCVVLPECYVLPLGINTVQVAGIGRGATQFFSFTSTSNVAGFVRDSKEIVASMPWEPCQMTAAAAQPVLWDNRDDLTWLRKALLHTVEGSTLETFQIALDCAIVIDEIELSRPSAESLLSAGSLIHAKWETIFSAMDRYLVAICHSDPMGAAIGFELALEIQDYFSNRTIQG